MISVGNKEVTAIRVGERVVATVYIGARLVWQAIRSCFGAGFWRGDKPWSRKKCMTRTVWICRRPIGPVTNPRVIFR